MDNSSYIGQLRAKLAEMEARLYEMLAGGGQGIDYNSAVAAMRRAIGELQARIAKAEQSQPKPADPYGDQVRQLAPKPAVFAVRKDAPQKFSFGQSPFGR